MFYEDVLTNPEREVERPLRYLDQPFDSKAVEHLRKPSHTARSFSACITKEDPARAWLTRTTPEQIERGLYWLSVFGLDEIYGDNPMPNSKRAFEMLAANERGFSRNGRSHRRSGRNEATNSPIGVDG